MIAGLACLDYPREPVDGNHDELLTVFQEGAFAFYVDLIRLTR